MLQAYKNLQIYPAYVDQVNRPALTSNKSEPKELYA